MIKIPCYNNEHLTQSSGRGLGVTSANLTLDLSNCFWNTWSYLDLYGGCPNATRDRLGGFGLVYSLPRDQGGMKPKQVEAQGAT